MRGARRSVENEGSARAREDYMPAVKTRRRWVFASAIVVALAALGGYVALGLRSTPREKAPAVLEAEAWLTDETQGEAVALVGAVPGEEELRAAAKGGNVIICLLDEVRPDHCSCYGYPRETTPNVDRLAPGSVVFTKHFCPVPFTRSSTASLLTSQYPDTHNVFRRQELPPSVFTLESALADAGWSTAFFTANIQASPAFGLGQDFGYTSSGTGGDAVDAGAGFSAPQSAFEKPEPLLQQISEWLKRGPRRPFFAYLHFRHPHAPYDAPADMQRLFAGVEPPGLKKGEGRYLASRVAGLPSSDGSPYWEKLNQYDANLRYADWAVGELEKILREQDAFDNTLLIITSDHGDTFGEREKGSRRWCMYDEAVRIPLVIRFPRESGPTGYVRALTETVDLLPTILNLFDVPYPREQVQGRSLLPLLTGSKTAIRQYVFARTDEGRPKIPASYLVRDLRWALILQQGGKNRELYDLEADPGQTRNVIAQHPEQAQKMIRGFRGFAATQTRPPLDFVDPEFTPPPHSGAPLAEMTEDTRRQLRALGYVD